MTTFLQPGPYPVDARGVTALSVLMAQFVANDIYRPRVPPGNLSTSTVPIPPGDPFFSPSFFTEISFPNVTTTPDTRTSAMCPDPISDTSPFIDLSQASLFVWLLIASSQSFLAVPQVYGTDMDTLNSVLRGPRGTLAVVGSVNPLLPVNPNIPAYVMGDYRDNGSAALIAMHTLAVRNHNYWAAQLLGMRPDWTSDQVSDRHLRDFFCSHPCLSSQIFWKARQLNIAEWQKVVYEEWLPALLGALAPPPQSSLKVAEPTEATGVPSLEFTNVVLPAVIDTMMPGSLPAMTAVNGFQQISTAGTIDNALYAVLSKSAWMFDSDITSNILNVINGTQAVDYSVTAVQTARNLRVQVSLFFLFFSFSLTSFSPGLCRLLHMLGICAHSRGHSRSL